MDDAARVASLRARWTRITPQPHLGPGGQTGWQLATPDVMYLLDLAEEALRRRPTVTCQVCGARHSEEYVPDFAGHWGGRGRP